MKSSKSILLFIIVAACLPSCSFINKKESIENMDTGRSPSNTSPTCEELIHPIFKKDLPTQKTMIFETKPLLTIINETSSKIDEAQINEQFSHAINFFEKEIAPFEKKITISIQDKNCLRTGYNMVNNKIVFCRITNVNNYGLNSIDVFNHELFHALLCNFKPGHCKNFDESKEYIHEALADYFAYHLNPDKNFGEDFYNNKDFIRQYNVNWRVGLVEGGHKKGNALVSQLIQSQTPLKEALDLLDQQVQLDEVTEVVEGIPLSSLNRYRLNLNQEMKIEFQFSAEANVAKVVWESSPGLEITTLSDKAVAIKITKEISPESVNAVFYSSDGLELGVRRYYFASRK